MIYVSGGIGNVGFLGVPCQATRALLIKQALTGKDQVPSHCFSSFKIGRFCLHPTRLTQKEIIFPNMLR